LRRAVTDYDVAKGLEQLFINYGRKTKILTDQINSIDPKRVAVWDKRIAKALDWLKNHSDSDYQKYYNLLKDYTTPVK
jgi:hypothetical protein